MSVEIDTEAGGGVRAIPAILMLAAPAAVAVTLLGAGSVWLTYLCYHLGICLVLPALDTLLVRRLGPRAHARLLALAPPAGIRLGLALGAVLGGGTVAGLLVLGPRLLDPDTLTGALAAWGVAQDRVVLALGFLVVANGACEELFWRGWAHSALAGVRRRGAAIGIASALYASYHGVTTWALAGDPAVAALMLAVVFGAGLGWGWLRERTGSGWPALISHGMATGGDVVGDLVLTGR